MPPIVLRGLGRVLLSLSLLLCTPVLAQEAEPVVLPPDSAVSDLGVSAATMSQLLLPLTVDELAPLADLWLAHAREATERVVDLRLAMDGADPEQVQVLRSELTAALTERGRVFGLLEDVADQLALKGGDAAVADSYHAYRTAITSAEVQKTDWRTLVDLGQIWVTDSHGGIQFLTRAVVVLVSLIALVVVARVVRRLARRGLAQVPSMSQLLETFLAGAIYWLVLVVGLLVVLAGLGVNITPLFALFGGAAFILAFAMQETLGNLAAGIMIILNRPFDTGDYVSLAGVGGTVRTVSIVSTTVTTPDNQVIVIPNSKVWGDIITNVTASETRRVDLVFGISYEDSIAEAQEVLERIVAAHPAVLNDPAPVIRVHELADSSVNFICRPWVATTDYWAVYWDLMRQVKEGFDAAGLSIPYPQTDMHLHMTNSQAPAALSPPVQPPVVQETDVAEAFSRGDAASD